MFCLGWSILQASHHESVYSINFINKYQCFCIPYFNLWRKKRSSFFYCEQSACVIMFLRFLFSFVHFFSDLYVDTSRGRSWICHILEKLKFTYFVCEKWGLYSNLSHLVLLCFVFNIIERWRGAAIHVEHGGGAGGTKALPIFWSYGRIKVFSLKFLGLPFLADKRGEAWSPWLCWRASKPPLPLLLSFPLSLSFFPSQQNIISFGGNIPFIVKGTKWSNGGSLVALPFND